MNRVNKQAGINDEPGRRLLVLVPDRMLFLATSGGFKAQYEHDLVIGDHGMLRIRYFLRPGLIDFLDYCAQHFDIALWYDGRMYAVQDLLEALASDAADRWPWRFVWDDRHHCLPPSDDRFIIDGIVRRTHCRSFDALLAQGYRAEDIIIVDAEPAAWEPFDSGPPSNVLYSPRMYSGFGHIQGYREDTLTPLMRLLEKVRCLDDVRDISKELWSSYCNELP